MKILIIGGMGIIGKPITENAIKNNYKVWVMSRRGVPNKYKDLGIEEIRGNWLLDNDAIAAVSKNFDVIIDTLIFTEEELKRDIKIINKHCKHFIYISSDAVYPHPGKEIHEDYEINLNNLQWNYSLNKRYAELYLEKHSKEFSFRWTVVRPTVTFGETRIPIGFTSRKNEWTLIDRMLKRKPIVLFDAEGATHPLCCAKTFGEAVIKLLMNKNCFNQFYHISNDGKFTYDEILYVLASKKGIVVDLIRVPVKYLKKLDYNKYEEMIFDKNPTFSLSNKKIKSVAPEIDYTLNLESSLENVLNNLENNKFEIDEEYNMISDILLMKFYRKVKDKKTKRKIKDYLKTLSLEYKIKLWMFNTKKNIISMIKIIKRLLIIKLVTK